MLGGADIELKQVLQLQLFKHDVNELMGALTRRPPVITESTVDNMIIGRFAKMKVTIGGKTISRICRIDGVTNKDGYTVGGITTFKHLKWKKDDSLQHLKFTQLQDSLITSEEVAAWLSTFKNTFPPSTSDLETTWEELKRIKEKLKQRLDPPKQISSQQHLIYKTAEPAMKFEPAPGPAKPFYAKSEWCGQKLGYFFGTGPEGLGYHKDIPMATMVVHSQSTSPQQRRISIPSASTSLNSKQEPTPVRIPPASLPPYEAPIENPFDVNVNLQPTKQQLQEGPFATTGNWSHMYVDQTNREQDITTKKQELLYDELDSHSKGCLLEEARVQITKRIKDLKSESSRSDLEIEKLKNQIENRRKDLPVAEEEVTTLKNERSELVGEQKKKLRIRQADADRLRSQYDQKLDKKEKNDEGYREDMKHFVWNIPSFFRKTYNTDIYIRLNLIKHSTSSHNLH